MVVITTKSRNYGQAGRADNVQNIVHCKNMVRAVADHNLVETVVRLKGRIEIKLESRQRRWKELDVKKFKTHLEAKNWDAIIEMKDPDLAYNAIEENLKGALEKFIPIKKVQRKKDQKSWITTETRTMMEDRDRARAKAAESNEDDDWKSYRKMRNKVVEKVRKYKKEHFKELFDKAEETNDVKNTFRIAKEQLGWNTGGPPTALVKGGKLFSKPVEVAEEMSRHFDEKIRTLELNRPKSDEDPLEKLKKAMGNWTKAGQRKVFKFREVTILEVLKVIKELSNTTTMGYDGLDSLTIKLTVDLISRPILHVVNLSLKMGKFCNKWKFGKLIPLHKGGDLDKLNEDSYSTDD